MTGVVIFFGTVALIILALVARIACDVSDMADIIHDRQGARRHD